MRTIPRLEPHTLALVFLVVTGVVWGCNWVVMKIAVQYASPFTFAALRMLGAAAVLAIAGVLLRRPMRPELPLHVYAILGLFQSAGFVGLATWAVVDAGAGKVAILSYTMPLWAALLAWPFLGERINVRQGIAILIACLGIVCMVGRITGAWFPDLLAVMAGLSWAIGVIYMKAVVRTRTVDLYRISTWQMLFAGLVLAIVAGASHRYEVIWSREFVLALLYNVVIATAFAYTLWFFVLAVLPAGDASMGSLLAPIVGIAAAAAFLQERPALLELVGMALVLAGIALLIWIRAKPNLGPHPSVKLCAARMDESEP